MQRILMFLNYGTGWIPLNDHANDIAALANFTLNWGVDSIGDDSTPAVLNFTLVDRTAKLAGNPTVLAGARVIVQIGRIPIYTDINSNAGTYAQSSRTLATLYKDTVTPLPNQATSDAITIFNGLCSTGGSVEPFGDDAYKITLQASSTMVLWKRLSAQGPTNSAQAYNGKHWTDISGSARFNELSKRAHAAGAPELEADGISFPGSVAPYSLDSYPEYLTLLQKLTNHLPELYMWCEKPKRDTSVLAPFALAENIGLAMNTNGELLTLSQGEYSKVLDAARIAIDSHKLNIPEPITQITVKAQAQSRNSSNELDFTETDVSYTAPSLPTNLQTVQKTLSRDSDAIASSSDGTFATWQPSAADRAKAERNIVNLNTRVHPNKLIFLSSKLDPVEYPELYASCPSPARITTATRWKDLEAVDAPFKIIGGTLSYTHNNGNPRIRHEVNITTVAIDAASMPYSQLHGLTATYKTLHTMRIRTLQKISRIKEE